MILRVTTQNGAVSVSFVACEVEICECRICRHVYGKRHHFNPYVERGCVLEGKGPRCPTVLEIARSQEVDHTSLCVQTGCGSGSAPRHFSSRANLSIDNLKQWLWRQIQTKSHLRMFRPTIQSLSQKKLEIDTLEFVSWIILQENSTVWL